MSTVTSTSQSLPAYQEEYLKNLLSSAEGLANQPTTIPDYQVAEMTPAQQRAIQLGIDGIGAYQPMMQAGATTLGQGVAALTPSGYQQFMNPYNWVLNPGCMNKRHSRAPRGRLVRTTTP